MPELIELKRDGLGNKVCVETVEGSKEGRWEFLDDWVARNILIRIQGDYYTLEGGIHLSVLCGVSWTDEVTGWSTEDWRNRLRAVSTARDWDEIDRLLDLSATEPLPEVDQVFHSCIIGEELSHVRT